MAPRFGFCETKPFGGRVGVTDVAGFRDSVGGLKKRSHWGARVVTDIGNFVRRLKAVEETKPLGKSADGMAPTFWILRNEAI